ncbi:hypothetical protein CWRG_00654 [Chthonomonas calidirosea]|uniref:hypothetical protein n=1 Tax=Chthonomonas calidirosea TaxID=454171 RepID=UPI0006DD4341|nr:hypothetical protein [Chthonomonas calidirosea]CEK13905.1 hypothetical protein CWRG_00654 [Chthonomonas calidirosea]
MSVSRHIITNFIGQFIALTTLCGLIGVAEAQQTPESTLLSGNESQNPVQLMQRLTPALVTVKIVYKTQMSAEGQSTTSEGKTEATGVVVSPDGLIMLATSSYSFDFGGFLGNFGGGGDNTDFKSKTIPTDFKVTVGHEQKDYNATLVATDTILGLTFIQITDLQGKKLEAVDMSQAAQPTLGEKVILFSRLSKGYDYAPYFHITTICGEIQIPRHAYLLDGAGLPIGLPVYDLGGKPLGILTTLAPTVVDTDSSGMGMQIVQRLFSGGGFGQIFLVPAESVNTIIMQAKERAAKLSATTSSSSSGTTAAPSKK